MYIYERKSWGIVTKIYSIQFILVIGFGHGLTEGGQPSGEFYGYMELPRCLEACYTKRTNGDHDVNGVVYFPTNQQCNCERNTRAHANDAASLHYTLHDVPGKGLSLNYG